ncbi:MAG TPA: hypothetical protein VH092_24470 [Urbifossiella sp.]|jgi:hypothetical protein|nr:hypothetical protein [Urbifossiella sp.]
MRRVYAIMVAVVGSATVAAEPGDGAISERLVGRWTTCVAGGSSTEADGTIRYGTGGTFVAEGQVSLGGGPKASVRIEGTWKVEDGAILHAVTKSSHPGLAPVGSEMRERVVSIDDQTLRVKRGVGRERERKRMAG